MRQRTQIPPTRLDLNASNSDGSRPIGLTCSCGPQIFRRASELIENAERQARAPTGEIAPSRHHLTR
jgi:hypothetical protein